MKINILLNKNTKFFLRVFLFCFFIIYFLSCSNDITNLGSGIDNKYFGTYSGNVYKNTSNISGYAYCTVNKDGSLKVSITFNSVSEEAEISKENIRKISDNSYQAIVSIFNIVKNYNITFENNIMNISIKNSEDNSIISGLLNKNNY